MFSHAFFDLDGTIYVDGKLLPGIRDSLYKLKNSGTKIFYMTNNSSVSIKKYYEKLEQLDLPLDNGAVISPVITLSKWMLEEKIDTFYAVGTSDFSKELSLMASAEFDAESPQLVVVAFDTDLTYSKIKKACQLINSGVPWVMTHVDLACPSEFGPIPDCGAIAKLVELTTNVKPLLDFGKPSKFMQKLIKDKSENSKSLLISGDRYYTDAKIGLALEATTVLVCTGEFKKGDDIPFSNKKLYVENSLSEYLAKTIK